MFLASFVLSFPIVYFTGDTTLLRFGVYYCTTLAFIGVSSAFVEAFIRNNEREQRARELLEKMKSIRQIQRDEESMSNNHDEEPDVPTGEDSDQKDVFFTCAPGVTVREMQCGDDFNLFVDNPDGTTELLVSIKDTTSQDCCEEAYIEYWQEIAGVVKQITMDIDKTWFLGRHVCSVESDEDFDMVKCTEIYSGTLITITFDGGDQLLAMPVNKHNGYYPHTFVVEINNTPTHICGGNQQHAHASGSGEAPH